MVCPRMELDGGVNERFRRNLHRFMLERGFTAASLSRAAGLNSRAVKDIEEGKAQSPRLTTVIALARALDVTEAELLGLQPCPDLSNALHEFLRGFDLRQQENLLALLRNILEGSPEAAALQTK